jgi:hypothetical protein
VAGGDTAPARRRAHASAAALGSNGRRRRGRLTRAPLPGLALGGRCRGGDGVLGCHPLRAWLPAHSFTHGGGDHASLRSEANTVALELSPGGGHTTVHFARCTFCFAPAIDAATGEASSWSGGSAMNGHPSVPVLAATPCQSPASGAQPAMLPIVSQAGTANIAAACPGTA